VLRSEVPAGELAASQPLWRAGPLLPERVHCADRPRPLGGSAESARHRESVLRGRCWTGGRAQREALLLRPLDGGGPVGQDDRRVRRGGRLLPPGRGRPRLPGRGTQRHARQWRLTDGPLPAYAARYK